MGIRFSGNPSRRVTEPNDVVLSASIKGDRAAVLRYLEWETELGKKHEARVD